MYYSVSSAANCYIVWRLIDTYMNTFSGMMDTYMDTSEFIGFPFNFLEFFFCNDIVASKNWSGSVAGDGHDGEMVVAGEAQKRFLNHPKVSVIKYFMRQTLMNWFNWDLMIIPVKFQNALQVP